MFFEAQTTLPETNSLPLKIGGLEDCFIYLPPRIDGECRPRVVPWSLPFFQLLTCHLKRDVTYEAQTPKENPPFWVGRDWIFSHMDGAFYGKWVGLYTIITLECLGVWLEFAETLALPNDFSFRKQNNSWHYLQEKQEFIWIHHVCHHARFLTTIPDAELIQVAIPRSRHQMVKSMHQNICTGTTSSHIVSGGSLVCSISALKPWRIELRCQPKK